MNRKCHIRRGRALDIIAAIHYDEATIKKDPVMKPILIFRHLACEGPGYFAEFLHRHRIPSRLIAIDEMQAVPKTLDDTNAMVFMGGPMSVNDDLPWIQDELALISQAKERGIPVLGHCLGGQLIAKALGARVYPNAVKEIGWLDISQVSGSSPWLKGLPQQFEVFHWHGETFDIPHGAEHLLQSTRCRNQAFACGNMLAMQFHIEMTVEMVNEWANVHDKELAHPTASVQSHDTMIRDLPQRIWRLQEVADVLYGHWLKVGGIN